MCVMKEGEEEIGSLTEGDFPVGHDEIDRVEVFLATEAPGKVGFGIGGGVELVAEGTEEAEEALGELVRDPEDVGDDEVDRDVVSQVDEGMPGETFLPQERILSHGSLKVAMAW